MQRVNVGLLCLSSLLFASVAAAQTAVQPTEDVGSASLQDFSGGATIRGTYFDVRHQSGSGVGYQNGYTQIGAFTPFWLNEDSFIASNSRLLLTDTSEVGVNSGLVARRYSDASDRIFGINGYFDADKSTLNNRYRQATLGFETLGQGWDFRANGYVGLGKTDRFIREIGVGGDPFFTGNQLAFLGQQLREESLSGADFEFGFPVFQATPWLRAYAGMYGYQSSSKEPIGVRGRMEAWVSDDLSVAVNVTDDRQFGTNVNAVVDFRFAGFRPTRYFPQWSTRERMLMPVQRNWRVATDTYVQDINIAAVNPADGLPYFVSHINNTAAAGGDGSFEHPFKTLPASVPGADIILVAAGTTDVDSLLGPIALGDNQRFLGEGKRHNAHMFATYGGKVIDRIFDLPGATDSGNYPFLSSPLGDNNIITLANNNEVAGFNLLGAGGDAITNTAAGSNNFLLQCLEISGNGAAVMGGRGINLQNATGTGIIRGVNLMSMSTNHLNPSGFGNNLGGGIFVGVGAGDLNLSMTDVAMNSDPAGTQEFGIRLQETGRNLVATLNNVQSSGNAGVGVQVLGDGGSVTLTATTPGGPLISNDNGGDNLNITLINGTLFQGDIVGGQFNRSLLGSGVVYNHSGGVGELNFLNLRNLQANDNAIDGIHVQGMTGSKTGLFVDASDARFNGRDGLFFDLHSGSTLKVTSTSNLMDHNDRSAIFGQMDASTANLDFSNTTGNLSGEHGMFLNIVNGSTFIGQVTNGNFTNSLENALNANFAGNSTATLVLDNTPLDNSGADGMHITLTGALTDATITLQNGTTNDNSGQDGLDFNGDPMVVGDGVNGGHLTVNALASSFTNSGQTTSNGNGILGEITNSGLVNLNFTDTPITGSFNNGMFVTATGGSDIRGVFDNSSFNGNGLTTASTTELDGIRLVLDGSLASSLQLLNGSTVNGNGGDGLELIATNRTNFIGDFQATTSFSDNGQNLASLDRRGVSATVDNSTVNLMFNAVDIVNNLPNATQQIGFQFDVLNHGALTAGFTGGDLSNNTQNAFNGRVTGTGLVLPLLPVTSATVNLSGTVADNSGADGAVLLVTAGGRQDFRMLNASSIDNSGGTGLVGTFGGANALGNNVSLDASTIDGSFTFGAFLEVTGAATLNLSGTNISSISDSGATGVFVTSSDANTVVNIDFKNMSVDFNGFDFGGEGLNGAAVDGGTLNGCFDNTSFSRNANEGVELLIAGDPITNAKSLGQFGVNTSVFDNNVREGLRVDVSDLGVLNYRSQNTSYSGNGTSGAFDGVNATVTGTGAADTATARFLFSTDTVNGNTDDGFEFNATNGATLVTSLDATTAINNAGFGLNFNANAMNPTDMNTKAYLLMTGANQLAPNTLGSMNINIGAVNQVVLQISGSYDDSAGDGIGLSIIGATNALVAIQGPGTIDRSGDDGIDILMQDVTNGSILIEGLTSITDSQVDGIHIVMDNVTSGALEINGATTINNSGQSGVGDAIDITLQNGTTLEDVTATLGAMTVDQLTLVNSLTDDPLTLSFNEDCLPAVVTTDLNTLGLVAEPFTINAMTIDNSADRGISVLITDSTIATGTGEITGNFISNSLNGDGLLVTINNAAAMNSADGLLIDGNSSSDNSANGFNFDFTNSPIDSLTITNNTGGISVNTALNFLIDGNTFPIGPGTGNFSITNASQPGIQITDFTFDTSTSVSGAIYNTVSGANFPFTPFGGTDTTTGLATVTGTPVPPYPNNLVPDFTQLLDFTFTDFDSGENFVWDIDADLTPGGDESVFGNDLIGSTISVNFTGGLNLGGTLVAVLGNPDAAEFIATSGNIGGSGIANNGLDGVRFSLNNSSLTNLVMDGNQIEANGTTGTGHGINFQTVTNSDITAATISNNTIDGNVGDGFRLLNPTTAGGSLDLTFTDNTINGNTGAGVNLSFDGNHTGPAVNLDFNSAVGGNQITSNGSFGVHVVATDTETAPITLTVGGTGATNLFGGNAEAGMGLEFQNTAAVAHNVTVSNATFSGTTNSGVATNFNGDGLGIRLTNAAQLASLTIGDALAVNTTFGGATVADRNAGDGFTLFATDNTIINGPALIQNVNALGNGADGLHIDARVFAQIADLQIVSTLAGDTIGSNTLHGIQLNRIDNSTLTTLVDGVTVTGNTGDGLNGFYGNGAGLQRLTIQNSQINQNTDGIDLTVAANAQLLATISDNTLDSHSNNGILVTTNNAAAFGDDLLGTPSLIEGNRITDSLNRATDAADAGMRFNANDGSFQNVLVQASAANRTAISGYGNGITVNNASSFNRVAPTPTQNTWTILGTDISGNAFDGIQLNMTGSGGSVVNIGGLVGANANVTIAGTRVGDTQNGINANLTAGTNNLSIGVTDGNGAVTNTVDITSMGRDGININQTGGRANVAILNTSSRLNVRRGLNILDSATRAGAGQPQDTYVVGGGGGARDINGAAVGALGDGNIFSSNDQQGLVFDTLSTQVSNSQFAASDPFNTNIRDLNSTNFTFATLYAIGNTIQNSVNADGMVLSVGSNTRLNAMVSGNRIDANALDDVRIFATASVNPASSTNNAPTAPTTNNDVYVRDPVAHLDLVFGALDNNNDGIPETIGTVSSINVGNQVNAVQFGGGGTAGITRSGVFSNADPFKTDRRVLLVGQIQIENGTGQLNFPNNNFIQFATQQIMFNGGVFDFFTPNASPTTFPNPAFAPFP